MCNISRTVYSHHKMVFETSFTRLTKSISMKSLSGLRFGNFNEISGKFCMQKSDVSK